MKLNMSPTREKFPLSYNKVYKKVVGSMLGSAITLLILSVMFVGPFISATNFAAKSVNNVFDIFYNIASWYLLFLLLTFVWQVIYQRWYFAVYYYEITDNFLVIRKDPITPKEITIPWERIQDVYVDQDLLDRIFGLYDVHLSTATFESGIQAHIDGVEKPAADGLREVLLSKVKSKISQATPVSQ